MLPADERRRSRPGRIRWINGGRRGGQAWDAYEALSGQPLVNMLGEPQTWASVRYWLLDLTRELELSAADDSLPAEIGLEHVWITGDGHAKLLDFPAPGADEKLLKEAGVPPVSRGQFDAGVFLQQLSRVVLRRGTPPPLHAGKIIQSFPTTPPAELLRDLTVATEANAVVSRLRRMALVLFCLALPLMMFPMMMVGIYAFDDWQSANPDILPLRRNLDRVIWLEQNATNRWQSNQLAALETYISGRYRRIVSNPETWETRYVYTLLAEGRRARVEALVKRPPPSAAEFEESRKKIAKYLENLRAELERHREAPTGDIPGKALTFGVVIFTVFVAAPGLVAALAFRGGMLMHFLGLTFVTRDGQPAARWRVFLRNLITWCPVYSVCIYIFTAKIGPLQNSPIVWIGLGAYALLTLVTPSRGLQDRIAGTWLVPR